MFAVLAECAPGYATADCKVCPINTFSPGGKAAAELTCTPCADGKITAKEGAKADTDCMGEMPHPSLPVSLLSLLIIMLCCHSVMHQQPLMHLLLTRNPLLPCCCCQLARSVLLACSRRLQGDALHQQHGAGQLHQQQWHSHLCLH